MARKHKRELSPGSTRNTPKGVKVLRDFLLVHNGVEFRFKKGQTWELDSRISYPGDAKEKKLSPMVVEEYKDESIFKEI